MIEAVKVFVEWANLQVRELKIGLPLREIQEYEKMHHQQLTTWCAVRNIDVTEVYKICGFPGPGNARDKSMVNYQQAANRGEGWIDAHART